MSGLGFSNQIAKALQARDEMRRVRTADLLHRFLPVRAMVSAKERPDMTNPKVPSEEDPVNPHSDEGKPGADENAAGFVKPKL